jgi:23S rRNA pseudouridine955/2504/2580 synthase
VSKNMTTDKTSTKRDALKVPEASDGQRLDRWLKKALPDIPYVLLQKAMRKGEIRLDGKRVKGDEKIAAGQAVRVPPFSHVQPTTGEDKYEKPLTDTEIRQAKAMKIYDDAEIVVLNKPAGLATQGGSKTLEHLDRLLVAFSKDKGEKPKLVHRLDKDTSGVIVVAKTRAAAEYLGNAFKNHEVDKTYLAITLGVPHSHYGSIKAPLLKRGSTDGDKVVVDKEEGKFAQTDYRVLAYNDGVALVACRPLSGRMHQIRVHLAHLGNPILGDGKYGGGVRGRAEYRDLKRYAEYLWLHALALDIPHPKTNKRKTFVAPVPPAMQEALEGLGLHVPEVTDTNKPYDVWDDRLDK